MSTFRSILFAAVCLAVLFAPTVSAQTQPYSISTYTGNGQMVCGGCPQWSYTTFDLLVAKVVDATGAPVVGTPVTWYVSAGNGFLGAYTTNTDSNGLAQNSYWSDIVLGTVVQPFISSQIVANVSSTGANSYAIFYETQVLALSGGVIDATVEAYPIGSNEFPVTLSGAAGTTGQAMQIYVHSYGTPIPGVEVQLINYQSSPSVTCAASGSYIGDPGTIMTDSTGLATCNPVLAGSGTGGFEVLVGGVAVWSQTLLPQGFRSFDANVLNVTKPSPAAIQVTGGNNQTVTAGQSIPTLLTAIVKDTNSNLLAAQAVTWTATPASAGVFVNTVSTSDSNGKVQTGFTFSANASGNVTIKVAIAGNSAIYNTFTLTAIPLISIGAVSKVAGGDNQTTTSGQVFSNPLVVSVTTSGGQPVSGATVNFSATGNAGLSVSSATTNSAGQAQVIVTAPVTSSQETLTVTATSGGLFVNFTLTVNPAGPVFSASGFVNAADQKGGSLSPCSMATVYGTGIAPSIQGTTVGAYFGPGLSALSGASLTLSGTQAPLFSIANNSGTQSLTFQVPCEVTAGASSSVIISLNGGNSTAVNVPILAASPGIYGAVGSDSVNRATLVRQDGSFVSLSNPARRGETVTAFLTGLGPTTPQVGTNQLPPRGATASVNGTTVVGVGVGGVATLVSAQLTADLVGVYQVSFVVPANLTTGNSIGFSVGLIPTGATAAIYSNLLYIPVQ